MDQTENPIEELYNLLEVLLKHNVADSSLNAWASALKFNSSNTDEAVSALKEVLLLIERCESAAQHIPGDKELFLTPLRRVQQMLKKQNLTTAWQNSINYLDGATMTGLKYGVYAINQFYPGAQPEKSSSIRDYVRKIDDLLEEFLKSDLPDEVKNLFAKHLHALSSAMTSIRINGVDNLEDTLDTIYGSLYRRSEAIHEASPGNEGIIRKFMDMLGNANELASGWQNASALLTYSSPMLLPLIKTVA
ncbi:hypothetical protein DQ397_000723 [Pseudomonas sp. CK-NBRI-02]|uniref:hypothetical protein n=1 Tax=Pseudomonas sp. CK-NBRI-02 TaxID=2249759 RepID=UPI0005BA0441|nr:hypothetical protein [Pseudomonas sp. CK-NBRI-02]TYO83641.1 hypothetical protein DQ397_000723 [Pseudomonas sp. CK-NBRI-02]